MLVQILLCFLQSSNNIKKFVLFLLKRHKGKLDCINILNRKNYILKFNA